MEEINNNNFEKQIVHSFSSGGEKAPFLNRKNLFLLTLFLLAGVLSGYLLNSFYFTRKSFFSSSPSENKNLAIQGQTFGSSDEKTFKDQATGTLKSGGIDGEGAFHLERDGGASQNVYLTSSTLDLFQFLDKKVRVWGATNQAKKAGWLMDVGRLQVIE